VKLNFIMHFNTWTKKFHCTGNNGIYFSSAMIFIRKQIKDTCVYIKDRNHGNTFIVNVIILNLFR
jgi:hypothetical protein